MYKSLPRAKRYQKRRQDGVYQYGGLQDVSAVRVRLPEKSN